MSPTSNGTTRAPGRPRWRRSVPTCRLRRIARALKREPRAIARRAGMAPGRVRAILAGAALPSPLEYVKLLAAVLPCGGRPPVEVRRAFRFALGFSVEKGGAR